MVERSKKEINWLNAIFLVVSPILVITFLPIYFVFEGFDYRLIVLLVAFALATSLSITAGYHRLFAHRSYEAKLPLKLFYLIFGSAALQGSALKWASDHRRHHKHVDGDDDPYAIKNGFLYAHIGWVFFKDDPRFLNQWPADLKADPLLVFQDKHNFAISIFAGFLTPTLIGLTFGAPWGGLLFGTLARVVLSHHCTFFINSLCHMWGSQPYSDKNTARDNFLLAFFTYGEGYHNFHHRFEADYRNGIRWYHWDPTKWWIRIHAYLGLAQRLRRISEYEILRARISNQEKKLIQQGTYDERMKALRLRIDEALKKTAQMRTQYNQLKRGISAQKSEAVMQVRIELKLAKSELQASLEQWRIVSSERFSSTKA